MLFLIRYRSSYIETTSFRCLSDKGFSPRGGLMGIFTLKKEIVYEQACPAASSFSWILFL